MDTFQDRMRFAVERAGGQTELAKLVSQFKGSKVNPQAIQYLCDDNPPRGKPARSSGLTPFIAAATNLNSVWLATGNGEKEEPKKAALSLRPITTGNNEDELDPDIYVFIPSLDIQLSAGNGNLVWEVDQKGQQQAFRRKWANRVGINPSCAATMTADDNSMEPRIMDGDSLVVDYCQTTINEGKVYALGINGEVFVKRIHKEIEGSLRISSDNSDKNKYPDKLIPAERVNQVQIIGRVIAVIGGI